MAPRLRVGCAGFPVGQDRYWRTFSFVEARTGAAMPRPATLQGWRDAAPEGAEFSVQAGGAIAGAGFRETLEAYEAWVSTKKAAEILEARIIVFETPPSFLPDPDRLRDFYRFFKAVPRGRFACVWQPRGASWGCGLADKICADLGLIRAFDPLKERPPERGTFRYLRPRGPRVGGLSVDNLSTIRAAIGGGSAYVALTHRDAFRDAERLAEGNSAGK